LLVPWLLLRARNVTGDVGFRTTLPVPPERAHALIKDALLRVCRTRVLTKYPKAIHAACYYEEFIDEPLTIRAELESRNGGTQIDAVIASDGNTSLWLHERRRQELRKLVEALERSVS
jgi:hypothetical protein